MKPIFGGDHRVIQSFQESLKFFYGKVESLDWLLVELRSQLMKIYDFYLKFSTKDVSVVWELDSFLKAPLKYYNKNIVHVLLLALESAFNYRTIIYECTRTHFWTTEL